MMPSIFSSDEDFREWFDFGEDRKNSKAEKFDEDDE
jgi:hypothetical protein